MNIREQYELIEWTDRVFDGDEDGRAKTIQRRVCKDAGELMVLSSHNRSEQRIYDYYGYLLRKALGGMCSGHAQGTYDPTAAGWDNTLTCVKRYLKGMKEIRKNWIHPVTRLGK